MAVVHCKRLPCDVYIGRPGKWGNPFPLMPGESRDAAIEKYRAWLVAPEQEALRASARVELRGKVLGCWCAPKRCHGDVLAEIAESVSDEELTRRGTRSSEHRGRRGRPA
jgi:hypothetical protein